MNFTHQAVKVDSPLVFDLERFVEQIHQESLASPNIAPQIHTWNNGSRFAKPDKAQEAGPRFAGCNKTLLQKPELVNDTSLRFVLDAIFNGRVRGYDVQSRKIPETSNRLSLISAKGYPERAVATSLCVCTSARWCRPSVNGLE